MLKLHRLLPEVPVEEGDGAEGGDGEENGEGEPDGDGVAEVVLFIFTANAKCEYNFSANIKRTQ